MVLLPVTARGARKWGVGSRVTGTVFEMAEAETFTPYDIWLSSSVCRMVAKNADWGINSTYL